MAPKKSALLLQFQNYQSRLDEPMRNLLSLYLIEQLTQKEIALQRNQPLSKTRNEIFRALFELGKASNDPEYIKARDIFYPGKYDPYNEK